MSRPHPPKPRPRWGWLEWVVVAQTLLPALLFVPGVSAVRTPNRVAAYAAGLLAWAAVAWRGRSSPWAKGFPARPWLLFCVGWLGLSVLHPNVYSLKAAAAQAMLYVAVLSPAFWAGELVTTPRQFGRLMALLFVCNALSAAVGVGQVFRPETFNPPVIPALNNKFHGEDLMYVAADGRKVLRPCGLTDAPGAAAQAGVVAALLGLCWALRPIPAWRRLACAALAFAGVAVIYYSHVRFTLVMLVIGFGALAGLFALQGNGRGALALAGGGASLVFGALAWAARSVGGGVVERFTTLVSGNPGALYQQSRGFFVREALEKRLWEYPLGYGMGWWGMVHLAFADPDRISPVWVEVMIAAWVDDGGAPLLVGYGGAVAAALYDSCRVALTSRDRDLAFWASAVVAHNLGVAAACFSYLPFLSPLGLQFWLLAAALHAADRQARGRRA